MYPAFLPLAANHAESGQTDSKQDEGRGFGRFSQRRRRRGEGGVGSRIRGWRPAGRDGGIAGRGPVVTGAAGPAEIRIRIEFRSRVESRITAHVVKAEEG